jgi:CobQ-like glutamine amidotransferase family enzyme
MKTIIAALNSKYIHSALAPWYLKEYCGSSFGEIKVMEFTINNNIDQILSGIYSECPDVAAFSCYIWNISLVLKIAHDLKKVSPHTVVVLGGPEVSFDAEELLNQNPFVDYIVEGEGERAFKKLLQDICKVNGLNERPGKKSAVYRDESLIYELDELPSPFSDEMLNALGDRIAYFESSRGCPFSCSYCLSSTFIGVRYFSMNRVRRELIKLIDRGISQVKFVDRTFNCNKNRAMEIFEFIIRNGGNTRFHFEAAADLFDEEMIDLLSYAPRGMIQFEYWHVEQAEAGGTVRIGVGRDKAFNFYYQDNLDLLELLGAELVYFSPLEDLGLPEGIDGLYIGGGYPEVWARELESNYSMRTDIKGKISRGLPAYAECGGLMYMSDRIRTLDGREFEMAGLLPGKSEMTSSLKRFGYVNIEVEQDNILGKKGWSVRAHEFHYSSTCIDDSVPSCFRVFKERRGGKGTSWNCGFKVYNLLAGYPHLHFWSNTDFAVNFIKNCRGMKNGTK